jgi:hypothetical protein
MNDWGNSPGQDIRVALTATRYVAINKKIQDLDAPVCVAEMDLQMMFGILTQRNETLEHFLSLCTQEMMKSVNIDVEKRSVIIGGDCPLVYFNARPAGVSEFEDAFFERWAICGMLVFEMQIIVNPKTTVSISAIYNDQQKIWSEPKTSFDPMIQIIHTPKNSN